MPDEYQSPDDDRQDQGPTPDELQAAELAKTAQTLQLVREMNQTVAPLPATLPTQAAPVAPPPPPMTGTQPPPGALPPGALTAGAPPTPQPAPGGMPPAAPVQPPAGPPPPPTPQGRMYMGPSMTAPQESAFMQSPAGTRTNLMPPPSGPPPSWREKQDASDEALFQKTGVRAHTLGEGPSYEPPYSDASLANQQNMMRYNAMKAFDAGDRSPETMAAAMGVTGRTLQPKTHFGANGQVLQEQDGKIVEVRPPNAQKIAATKPNALLEKSILQLQKDISADRRDLAKKPLVAGVPDERPAMLHKKQQQLAAMTDQYNQAFQGTPPTTASGTSPAGPIQAPAPQGRPVKDKSGKTWIYTGTATDPKTDKDPSHWSAP